MIFKCIQVLAVQLCILRLLLEQQQKKACLMDKHTISLFCLWLQDFNYIINFNCIEEGWLGWTSNFDEGKLILCCKLRWPTIHTGCVQINRGKRTKPFCIIQINVELTGLIGSKRYNFSEVQVEIILQSTILNCYGEIHDFTSIRWCECSPHDIWWWPENIMTLGINNLWGIYLCPWVELIKRRPETIIDIIWIPEEFSR